MVCGRSYESMILDLCASILGQSHYYVRCIVTCILHTYPVLGIGCMYVKYRYMDGCTLEYSTCIDRVTEG